MLCLIHIRPDELILRPNSCLQGGAISYAAAVATAFGVRSCIVTAASSVVNLTVFDGHELHIVSTEETLTFEHTYTWWGKLLPFCLSEMNNYSENQFQSQTNN